MNYTGKLQEDKYYFNMVYLYRILLAFIPHWRMFFSPWYREGIIHKGVFIACFQEEQGD